MLNTRFLIAAAAICAITFSASAQRDNRHEQGVVTVVNSDTVDASRVEQHLKANAPQAPKDNGLPRFAIVGKEHLFYLGIGAQFLGEGMVDFGGDMPSPIFFSTKDIKPYTPGNGAKTQFGWQTSSIHVNIVALPGTDNQVGIFFKGNFLGSGNDFACNHFYAKYRGLLAGYTTSLFTDMESEPMTINFGAPAGFPFVKMFTASWTQNFSEHVQAAVGIDQPKLSVTASATAAEVNQRIPAIPLYVQYAWDGGGSHVRLSGLVRPIQYRDRVKDHNSTLTGLGAQLSAVTNLSPCLKLSLNAAYGRGIATYMQDDTDLGLDAVALAEQGKMGMTKSLGITAGLNCLITPKLTGNLVYSRLNNYRPNEAIALGDKYRYGNYVAANLIYAINRFVGVGVEYDYGYRRTFDGATAHANRLQLQLSVTI